MQALLIGVDWLPHHTGGLSRYFHGLVHALPNVGVAGTAVVLKTVPGDTAPLRLRALGDDSTPLREQWRAVSAIADDAARSGADVVNAHFAKFAYPLARRKGRDMPFVVHFHGPWADEMSVENPSLRHRVNVLMARHIERTVYRRADRLITLSEAFKSVLVKQYGVTPERIRVVPGAFEQESFFAAPERSQARRQLDWPTDRKILLTVRRLTRRMGLEPLLEAMETVRRAHPECLLLIGGKGMLAGELDAQIAQRGLENHVRRVGFISESDLPAAYAAADIYLVPSLALEGFGLTTVEALGAGTPVLGTPIGGTTEILRPWNPDLLFEGTTPDALASRIIQTLSGAVALPDRAACRAYAATFSWQRAAAGVRETFDDACRTYQTHAATGAASTREPIQDNIAAISGVDSRP